MHSRRESELDRWRGGGWAPKEDKSQTNEPNIGRGKIEENHGMGLPFQRPDTALGEEGLGNEEEKAKHFLSNEVD